jgi:hypothetical protein
MLLMDQWGEQGQGEEVMVMKKKKPPHPMVNTPLEPSAKAPFMLCNSSSPRQDPKPAHGSPRIATSQELVQHVVIECIVKHLKHNSRDMTPLLTTLDFIQ